jgi:hypothetical protein
MRLMLFMPRSCHLWELLEILISAIGGESSIKLIIVFFFEKKTLH